MTGAASVVFRTSGGTESGLGHVRRCLSLAEALREQGATSWFVVRGDKAVVGEVQLAGFECVALGPEDRDPDRTVREAGIRNAASLVLDSYELEPAYFTQLSGLPLILAALDDLGQTDLTVDLLINAGLGAEELGYTDSDRRCCLLGPRYALLRGEFEQIPQRHFAERADHVLVTLGGADPLSLTAAVTRWIAEAFPLFEIDVVIGPLVKDAGSIEEVARGAMGRVRLHSAPRAIRDLMLSADLAVSGGGQTTYELAATGTPTVALLMAQNQAHSLRRLSKRGVLALAGDACDPDVRGNTIAAIASLANNREARERMSRQGRSLVDGRGAARVATTILELAGKRS